MQWQSDAITEVVIEGMWTNSRAIDTILHVKSTIDTPVTSARDVLNNWQDHLVGVFCNNYSLTGARWVDKSSLTGATGFLLPDSGKPVAGGDAGSATAPGISVLVKKLISASVGSRSGRMYLPPPAEANVDENGLLAGAVLTSYNALLADFLNGLDDATQLVVVHKKAAGESPTSDVTGLIADPLLATQRRRMRR